MSNQLTDFWREAGGVCSSCFWIYSYETGVQRYSVHTKVHVKPAVLKMESTNTTYPILYFSLILSALDRSCWWHNTAILNKRLGYPHPVFFTRSSRFYCIIFIFSFTYAVLLWTILFHFLFHQYVYLFPYSNLCNACFDYRWVRFLKKFYPQIEQFQPYLNK